MIESLPEIAAVFDRHGGTDAAYLAHHHPRFVSTLREFRSTWSGPGRRVLDVGAHWLHQSLLWRRAGFDVTAVDVPATFALEPVQRLAAAEHIALLACDDLESADALAALPDDGIDVLLFTEILEHLAFNPVRLWTQLHRVLAPGARIVLTTPNHYALGSRAWQVRRWLRGGGSGIRVDDILGTPTLGHHWHEFSMSEVVRYFEVLSPDFVVAKRGYPLDYGFEESGTAARWLARRVPALRRGPRCSSR